MWNELYGISKVIWFLSIIYKKKIPSEYLKTNHLENREKYN